MVKVRVVYLLFCTSILCILLQMCIFATEKSLTTMRAILNDILTSYMMLGLILCFGLCFLFIVMPKGEGLRSYRMARRMMGCSYLVLFVTLVAEAISVKLAIPTMQQQMLRITIGILQAFLFTFALTTLIDVQFFTVRRFVREAFFVILPSLAVFILSLLIPYHTVLFILLVLFYAYKLVEYVIIFSRRYHDYERRMADFFSDDERRRLLWVKRSFFTALSIGILAFAYALFPYALINLLFTLVMTIYYVFFGIRFINYAFSFQQIETALTDTQATDTLPVPQLSANPLSPTDDVKRIMSRLSALMTEQHLYVKPDLTIEEVAVLVGESYRTVSAAINSCRDMNFKGWVNAYRVEEAERLIHEGYLEQHTTDALAASVGFANRISFYRVFKKLTGKSPTDYR